MSAVRSRRRGVEPVRVVTPNLGANASPTAVSRAVDQLADAVTRIGGAPRFVELELATGVNHVSHGLGRTPIGVQVVCQATAVDVTYDWTQPGNPHPDRVADVVSSAAARVRLFFL